MASGSPNKSWLVRRMEHAVSIAFSRAYRSIRIDSEEFLLRLRVAYSIPATSYEGIFSVALDQLDDVAQDVVKGSIKVAVAEGAGLGLGGFFTVVPDLSILAAVTIRMIQKLSLVYGFQFETDSEVAELWVAAASAAGVDISREVLEKTVVNRFVPAVIQRIAAAVSAEFAEKAAARAIPIASSAVGATLNYYFVRTWGTRAIAHFREKHLLERKRRHAAQAVFDPSTIA